jgi:2-keto-4-pentenoate hydratase/2-oxohepta-3-ene-1,7-dioic acid hydratase in catechol pathway
MKIFCVGRNYVEHAKELGNAVPDEPVIFMKPKSALLQAHTPFYYPEFTNELHYECELVLRVSKNELKEKGLPWEKAKAWDNSAVIGKWLPLQNIKNKKDINFCLYKNKELVQQGNSGLMINSFDKIVAYISNYFSVNIGDLIFTGTPAGVGECVVGDELEIFIEDESMGSLEIK